MQRPPGLSLLPELWNGSHRPPAAALPQYPVSVFLQFKRPEYRFGANAAQYRLWRGPYYRFERTKHQHTVLTRLERNLAALAIVRYAAPAFDTVAELEIAQMTGTVVRRSGHVSPSKLGRHKVWTYQQPGTHGIPNPSGKPIAFEQYEDIFGQLVNPTSRPHQVEPYRRAEEPGLLRHLAAVAKSCRSREPQLRETVQRWSGALPATRLEPSVAKALVDFVTIQSLAAREQIIWLLAEGAPTS